MTDLTGNETVLALFKDSDALLRGHFKLTSGKHSEWYFEKIRLIEKPAALEKIVDPGSIRQAYDAAQAPKYLVQIIGADHIKFADTDLDDSQFADSVAKASRGDLTNDALAITNVTHGDAASCLRQSDETDAPIAGARQRELLRTAAAPFFDAYLRDDAGAKRFLKDVLPTLGGIRFEMDGG